MKSARNQLDFFSGAKGVVYLSSDYYIIDGDQAPTDQKEGLLACSKSAKPTIQLAKPAASAANSESARPAPQSAKPTAPGTFLESARPTPMSVKPTTPAASAQVGLADIELAEPTPSVSAAADASLDDSAHIVDHPQDKKNHIIQIKDIHLSDVINKVQDTNILLKFQSGHTILISAYIRDILENSYQRPIRNSIVFVKDKIKSDSIGQHIVPYGKAYSARSSKLKLLISNCKGVAEWIDVKSNPFVCLALKPTP